MGDSDGAARSYRSCLENKKLGVGFKFLSYRVFGGYEGGTRPFCREARRD